MVKSKRLRRAAVAFGVTLGVFSASVASAAWLASAVNQHGYSKYGSLQAVTTVDISATVTGNLFPGSNGDLKFRFSNPNAQAVTVASVDASAATFTGCTTPGASINGPTTITVGQVVPGGGTLDYTATNALSISGAASSDCQSAVLNVGGLTVNTTT